MDGAVGDNRMAELAEPSLTVARFQPHNPSAGAQTVQFGVQPQSSSLLDCLLSREKCNRGRGGTHTPPAIRDQISAPPW